MSTYLQVLSFGWLRNQWERQVFSVHVWFAPTTGNRETNDLFECTCFSVLHMQGSQDMNGQMIRPLNVEEVGWWYEIGF